MHVNKERARTAFADYVASYDPSNPLIALKIAHTYRVAQLCERIAPCEKDLAWLCGLLHDIGRFEQVRRYNTFNDAQSISHAAMGIDVLFGNADPRGPQIRSFIESDSEDELIRTAIATHSDYELPTALHERVRMHCNVLRDADKIDILKVNCICPLQDIYGVSEKDMAQSPLSPEVVETFYRHRTVPRGIRNYPADVLVGHICFAWELVYPASVDIMLEQGHLNSMLNRHFDNPSTAKEFARMAEHMRSTLTTTGGTPPPPFS